MEQQKADRKLLTDKNLLHKRMHLLTKVIIHDMFCPPVSSRIYGYTSLAAYELIRFDEENYPSLANSYKAFLICLFRNPAAVHEYANFLLRMVQIARNSCHGNRLLQMFKVALR